MNQAIAVVGLGNAGLPLAAVIADRGIQVVGVDVNEKRCQLINEGRNPIPQEEGLGDLIKRHGGRKLLATPRFEDASDCRTFIIIVPLFVDQSFNPDFGIMESAVRSVGRVLKKGDLVVLETTVPPGTTEALVQSWLAESSGLDSSDFHLAYSPERIMTGYSISRLREFPKVIGGRDEESGFLAHQVYSSFISNLHLVSSTRVAELIKVMEGCYRDVNIALANELFKIAQDLDVNFLEARQNANHQYCHIHLPSTGVGGHCIPVYPWFLIKEMEKREGFDNCRLLRTARELNDDMARYWAEKILLACLHVDRPLSLVRICIKGITFREGVKEFYHSRNLVLAKILRDKGLDVYVCDPLLSPEETEQKGFRYLSPEEADVVFDPFAISFEKPGDAG
ncbi:MAG: nucleotide sugar dehydrogenase [Methanotrichaceae archaeon]|nr:nucleotide sugar dehydrogenase [Methanotrichaceae archaeon]